MTEIVGLAALLSLPVLLFLFLRARRNRKIEFPHYPFKSSPGGHGTSRFSNFIRTRLDLLIDEACVVVLALALAAYVPGAAAHPDGDIPDPRKKTAVVIDVSRSMTIGNFGHRPLDRAIQRILSEKNLYDASVFVLGFDASKDETLLLPADGYFQRGRNVEPGADQGIAMSLTSRFDAFSVDYSLLDRLPEEGFTQVLLLTDGEPAFADGLGVVALSSQEKNEASTSAPGDSAGLPATGAAYPTAAGWDPVARAYRIVIVERGAKGAISVSVNEGSATARLPAGTWTITDIPGGVSIGIGKPGVYTVTIGYEAGPPAEFVVRIADRKIPAGAEGPFSTAALSVFPDIDRAGRPVLTFADAAGPEGSKSAVGAKAAGTESPGAGTDAGARGARFVTDTDAAESDLLLDPGRVRGKLVAAGTSIPPGNQSSARPDVSLSPASLANGDLVFLYDGLLSSTRWADRPQGFADPSEYFPETPRPGIAIPPAEAPRKLFAILLASLFAAKVALALLAHRPSSA